jgi:transcriptional regulator with PAS, ATPase and Fis domain
VLTEAVDIASRIGDDHGHARASLALARHALAEGRRVDAMTLAAEAHRLFQRIGAAHLVAEAAEVLAAISGKSAPDSPTPRSEPRPRRRSATATVNSESLVPGFITVDAGLLHTLGIVKTLAPRRPNILVHGESGTGKELIAQAVHTQSGRTGPFVPVNCSAFPGDLIEGELFGHARGAYTGADRERVGLFEHAHKGTLFLDEIGDMPVKAQARLLRALESGEVRRLGENTARIVDVRVVAATHRNLMAMVHAGEFRLDLYYRLAGFIVQIPPVRERPEDAKLLIDHFLARFAQEQQKSITLAPELREELATHSWPGNVREIRLVMERLVSLTGDDAVLGRLPFRLEGAPRPRSLPEALEAEERRRVLEALTTHNWNKQRAANALGTSRTTLIAKMQRMGIAIKKP